MKTKAGKLSPTRSQRWLVGRSGGRDAWPEKRLASTARRFTYGSGARSSPRSRNTPDCADLRRRARSEPLQRVRERRAWPIPAENPALVVTVVAAADEALLMLPLTTLARGRISVQSKGKKRATPG